MTVKPTKKTTRTLDDFRSIHDANVVVPQKIESALTAMLTESEEQWEYEQDFMRRAAISNTQLGAFREQFSDFIVEARPIGGGKAAKRIWFASKKVAAKAREAV